MKYEILFSLHTDNKKKCMTEEKNAKQLFYSKYNFYLFTRNIHQLYIYIFYYTTEYVLISIIKNNTYTLLLQWDKNFKSTVKPLI